MSSITHNPKYNLYQLKGTKDLYLFDYDYCQQVKKDLPYKEIPTIKVDDWYENLGFYRRKKIKVVTINSKD